MNATSPHPSLRQPSSQRAGLQQPGLRRSLLAVLLLALGGALPASAAWVTLTNTDASGKSSFTSGQGATNWDNGQAPSASNAYCVPSGKQLRTPANATAYGFLGASLTLSNGGALTFKGSGVITVANLIVTNMGTIYHSGTGATPDTAQLGGNLAMTNSPALTIDFNQTAGRTLLLSSKVTGSGALTIQNGGQVTLSGAQAYTGNATLIGASLELLSGCTFWPSNLIVAQDGATWIAPYFTNGTNWVRAGAALNVGYGDSSSVFRVGYRNSSKDTANPIGVFDASAATNFTVTVGSVSIGYNAVASGLGCAAGLVYLATNNTISAANSIVVADSAGALSPLTSALVFGRGSNYVNTPTLTVGARRQSATLTLPAGGVLVLTNTGSSHAVNLSVGANNATTPASTTNLMDLSGGTLVAALDNLVVGQKSSGDAGGVDATLTLSTSSGNAVTVNNVTLGSMAASTAGNPVASGTLNLNGGTLTVNNNLTLGSWDYYGSASAAGTLNLNSGVVAVYGNIGSSGGASTLNVNGGLLNLPQGGTITVDYLTLKGTITNAGSITVKNLTGNGSIVSQTGWTTVTGNLSTGSGAGAATLKLGSLSLDYNATLVFRLANTTTVGGGVNDLLDITGDLNLNNAQLSLTRLNSTLAVGTYRLANVTGQIWGTLQLPSVGRYTLTLVPDNNSSPAHLNLVVSGTPDTLLWSGAQGQDWDLNGYYNWVNQADHSSQVYFDSDSVRFDDSTSSTYVTVDVPVQPGSVVVSNNVNSYTLASTGAGRISGPTGLTKQGTGTLYMNLSNDFTGPVALSAGQVVLNSPSALGATNGPATIAANASLDLNGQTLDGKLVHVQGNGSDGNGAVVNNGSDSLTALQSLALDGATKVGGASRFDVSGSGAHGSASVQGGSATLTKAGTGTFGLSAGCNATFGDLLIDSGTVVLGGNSTLNADFGVTVSSDSAFSLAGVTTPMSRNVTVQNNGILQATSGARGQNAIAGTVTLNGNTRFDVSGGSFMTLAGQVTGPGALVAANSGYLMLTANNNNWSGGITISNGTLAVGSGVADGSLPNSPIDNYSLLLLNSSNNFTFTQPLSGTGELRKYNDGILTLAVSNAFTGPVNTGNGTPTSGGVIRLLNSYGFGDGLTPKNVSVLHAEVRLEGGIDIPAGIAFQTGGYNTFGGVGGFYAPFRNIAGTNIVEGPVTLIAGEGDSQYLSDAGCLVFNGPISMGSVASRSAIFDGAGDGVVNGLVSNQANALNVLKRGTGTWTFTAANTYTGSTTVSNGTLVVDGSIAGSGVTVWGGTLSGTGTLSAPVTLNATGTLSPGPGIGTLTLNNGLTLGGNLLVEVDKSLAQSSDLMVVSGLLTNKGTGTLTVTNLGPALAAGDTFTLFSKPLTNGNALTLASADGVVWTNKLALDGTIAVLSVPALVNTNPPYVTNLVVGSNMRLSWPTDHIGWRLQVQTNPPGVGLTAAWFDWPGSTTNSSAVVPIVPANGSVFLRMVYP